MSQDEGGGADNTVVLGGNSDAGKGGKEGGDNNSGAGDQNANTWLAALNEGNRKLAETKNWKDPNAQLDSYRELEREYSRVKSSKDGQAKGSEDNGNQPKIPQSATDYEFKLPAEFPSEGFYDKKFADTFKSWAHKARLSTEQAQSLHDMYVSNMAELVKSGQDKSSADFNTSVQNAFNDLSKSWGSPDTPGFKRSVELARRAMTNLDPGLKDALKARGVIATDAKGQEVVVDSTIIKALAKAGGRLFAEDELYGAAAAGDNPFDPSKPNLAKQGELIKSQPELAKTLIEAAGNKDWMWWVQKNFPSKK